MTAKQYIAAIAALGMTQGRAAEFLGISIRTSNGYANGWPIPESVAKLLRLMIMYIDRLNLDDPLKAHDLNDIVDDL